MKKPTNIILTTLVTILIVSVGQLNHVSAMPNQSDMRMVGYRDSTSYQQHCAVSHMGTAAKSGEQQKDVKKRHNKDPKPRPPVYLQFTCSTYMTATSHERVYTPPEDSIKVPFYRLYSVVRR